MKNRELSAAFLSSFCLELSLIVKAGVSVSEGLLLLAEDCGGREGGLLEALHSDMESGQTLSGALKACGRFPEHLTGMVEISERTGRMQDTLSSLSAYYERQQRFRDELKSAVTYPLVLLVMMLAVVVLLITEVLPIFNEVFSQLGAQMSPLAVALMNFGAGLTNSAGVICIVLGTVIVVAVLIRIIPAWRRGFLGLLRRIFGARGIWWQSDTAQLCSCFAMTVSSGLDIDESLRLSAMICGRNPHLCEKIEKCRARLQNGERTGDVLRDSGLFSARDSRLISLSFQTGSADEVMRDIARRSSESLSERISALIGRIEPALVIITCVIAAVVLLSVMLPLLGIMSALG